MSHVTYMNESCRTYAWVMSHGWTSHVTHMNESYCIHVWCLRVTWRIHKRAITRSCVLHDALMRAPWRIHVCLVTHQCVWHDSFKRVTWIMPSSGRKGVTLNGPSTWSGPFLTTRFVLVCTKKWTLPYYTFRFGLYQDYLFFDFIFQSEPRVSSFQMGIVIHIGIQKKWLVLERFHRNSQTIGSVRFSTRVVKKGSACDRSDQNLGFEAQGPLMFEYRNRHDIIGTLVCCSSVLQ